MPPLYKLNGIGSRFYRLLIKSSIRIENMNSFHTCENFAMFFLTNAVSSCKGSLISGSNHSIQIINSKTQIQTPRKFNLKEN